MDGMKRLTVFTPTYNRANVLHRVYDSLIEQTYKDFCWLIVDDGSSDETRQVVESFAEERKIEIQYIYQENRGKHVAINTAVSATDSELFVIADSDDSFVPTALEKLVAAWDSIEDSQKNEYKGVICRCYDAQTGKPLGEFPFSMFDSNDLDGVFKLKLNFEKWMLFRTDVLREFPFPEPNEKLKFYPEIAVWNKMGRVYKTRYIEEALRAYYRDQENALTKKNGDRFKENAYLWLHYVNDVSDYFWYSPFLFCKSFVGIWRDNLVNGKRFGQIMKLPNTFWKKCALVAFFPVGYVLSRNIKKRVGDR